MLPVVLAGAAANGRWSPVALAGGLVLSFTAVGVGVAAFGASLGLETGTLRITAAGVLLLSGVVMVHAPAQALYSRLMAPVAGGADAALHRRTLGGMRGQFVLGLLLGAVWSPCVGPTLGAAVGLAARATDLGRTTLVMLVFGTGTASVLLALALLSRRILAERRERLARVAAVGRKAFGWLLVAVGTLVVSGLDKVLETLLARAMPVWLLELTTRF
jgi:cytochrome c biogenesis protein CcdA